MYKLAYTELFHVVRPLLKTQRIYCCSFVLGIVADMWGEVCCIGADRFNAYIENIMHAKGLEIVQNNAYT